MEQADRGGNEDAIPCLLQHVEHFLVMEFGVENAGYPGADAVLHTVDRTGMGIDLPAEPACGIDRHLHFLEAHRRGVGRGRGVERVARDIELDVVATFATGNAHGPPHFFRTVDDRGNAFALAVFAAFIADRADHGDLEAAGADARAGDGSGVHRVADRHAQPQLCFRRPVNAGEPGIEQGLRALHGDQRVRFGRGGDDLVGAGGISERHVPVAFDHAGHQEAPGGLDPAVAIARGNRAGCGDCGNPVAFDRKITGEGRLARRVENRGIGNDDPAHACFPFE